MATARSRVTPNMDLPTLLDRTVRTTVDVVAAIEPAAWDRQSPCHLWTVRQLGNHMVGMISLVTQIVTGPELDEADMQPDQLAHLAHTERLGEDPVAVVRATGERCVAAFSEPGALERITPGKAGADTPGQVHALMCLNELLTHGWDLASGGGIEYTPDAEAVAAAREFGAVLVSDEARALGLFGSPVTVGPDADTLTAHLGHLGRRSPWPGIRLAA
jgi:uncharacterized protein (TIGR03086 family)